MVSPSPLQLSRLINSRAGRYVSSHPVVALALLLFAALAMLPVGLFLAFAVVTLAVSAVSFVALEGRSGYCNLWIKSLKLDGEICWQQI